MSNALWVLSKFKGVLAPVKLYNVMVLSICRLSSSMCVGTCIITESTPRNQV